MERTVHFTCGCSCVVDPFFTVPVREVDLVCPVHVEREVAGGRPETLAFFSDVEEVSDLDHLKLSLCAQYKWAFKEDSRGNDPVRTAARRIHNRILEANSEAEIVAAVRDTVIPSHFEFCPECGGLTAYAPTTELTREEYELLLSFRGCDCKIS